MKKLVIIGVMVLAVALAAPAMAFEKGTIRLGAGTGLLGTGTGFSISTIDYDSGGDEDIDIISVGGGYFLTDVVELTLDFANVDFGPGDTNVFGLGGKYYFPMGENSLYAGGGFQKIDAFGSDSNLFYVTGGYNYMLRDFFSIDFYLTLGKGDDFDFSDLGITYSVYFK